MNLEQFINSPQLKYAVITRESWLNDEVAQSIAPSPRVFEHQGVEMVLLSISKAQVQTLYDYVQGAVEYELTIGTGLVTLLLHEQVLALMLQDDEAA
jgi:hypothetical protein